MSKHPPRNVSGTHAQGKRLSHLIARNSLFVGLFSFFLPHAFCFMLQNSGE
jgi:hypothetical protein